MKISSRRRDLSWMPVLFRGWRIALLYGGFIGALVSLPLSGCSKKPASNKKEIVLWHWLTDREDALETLADQYEKLTGVKVRLEVYAPSDVYSSRIRASAQTNTLPDIFGVLGESWDFASYIKSGHVANLEPAMLANDGAWRKMFFPKALANNTFATHNQYDVPPGVYGVPIDVTNIQMLYNKALFKQAGLNPEHPPQTWEEWMADWHKLKAAGIPGFVSGWGETWMINCFASNYAFNIMGENKVLDTFRGKVHYTDPDWIRVFSLFDEIRREDLLVSGAVTMINKAAEQTFANGKAAFALNGSWCVHPYQEMNPDLSYAPMLPPKVSNKFPMRIWGGAGSSFMVNAQSPQKNEAIRFLQWLTEEPQQSYLSKETFNLPSNRASVGDLPPILAAFAAHMDDTTHPSQWPASERPTVTEAMGKGIQSILIGEKTPAQMAEDIETLKSQQAGDAASGSH
jgi:ABC-type glycerol-3-phosphate transport system substrate-binding protein